MTTKVHNQVFPSCRTLAPRLLCVVRDQAGGVAWAPRQRLTLAFEEMVVSLVQEMPIRTVLRLVGEHDTRLWRVVNHYVDQEPLSRYPTRG